MVLLSAWVADKVRLAPLATVTETEPMSVPAASVTSPDPISALADALMPERSTAAVPRPVTTTAPVPEIVSPFACSAVNVS